MASSTAESARRLAKLARHSGLVARDGDVSAGAGAGAGAAAGGVPAAGLANTVVERGDGGHEETKVVDAEATAAAAGGTAPAPAPASNATRWNGWGYADTEFQVGADGLVGLSGSRYSHAFEATRRMPAFRQWVEETVGLRMNDLAPYRTTPPEIHAPNVNRAFLSDIRSAGVNASTEPLDRLNHSHGHTCQEIYALRYDSPHRCVDAVVWPTCHEEVETIMALAVKNDVCLIPYGGGTSVSGALEVPEEETRMVVSVDMQRMNRIKWVDHENMMACIEPGILGIELEKRLQAQGVTMGHEPDSMEFSSLGGWVATRASGMKKNVYGNIEDIVVNLKVVTPVGTVQKGCDVPRSSTGPDVVQMVLGSEGTMGIVTEVIVRLRVLPEVVEFGSIAFPSFEAGVAALRAIAKARCAPASIRLVDNAQFAFGRALKTESANPARDEFFDKISKFYVLMVKGFDPNKMVAATLLFQGTKTEVTAQQKAVYSLAKWYNGLPAGEANGRRGYFLTYMIAYIRDFAMSYRFLAESFETSVPWNRVVECVESVRTVIAEECAKNGIEQPPFVSARVTQTYDTGACVYFYFGFLNVGLADPMRTFTEVESAARDAILACGGSLSHHHGVGKHRKKWMPTAVSPVGIEMIKGLKKTVDPTNVMGCRNLV